MSNGVCVYSTLFCDLKKHIFLKRYSVVKIESKAPLSTTKLKIQMTVPMAMKQMMTAFKTSLMTKTLNSILEKISDVVIRFMF